MKHLHTLSLALLLCFGSTSFAQDGTWRSALKAGIGFPALLSNEDPNYMSDYAYAQFQNQSVDLGLDVEREFADGFLVNLAATYSEHEYNTIFSYFDGSAGYQRVGNIAGSVNTLRLALRAGKTFEFDKWTYTILGGPSFNFFNNNQVVVEWDNLDEENIDRSTFNERQEISDPWEGEFKFSLGNRIQYQLWERMSVGLELETLYHGQLILEGAANLPNYISINNSLIFCLSYEY